MMKPVSFERNFLKLLLQCYLFCFPHTWYQIHDKTKAIPSHRIFIMARLNIQERIFIVETMTLTRSVMATWRKFNTKFGHKFARKTITDNVKKWKQFGSVQDCHKGNSGRKKSACRSENRDKVNSLIQNNSKVSVRWIASASGVKNLSFIIFWRRTFVWNSTSLTFHKNWRRATISRD